MDVRTKEEYYEGHLKGAILIPYDQIEKNIDGLEQYKNKLILVYCRTGRRSNIAVDTLKNSGFTEVYHMYDGISNWKYDVEK
ncbi:rhodanese domain containing protein [Clostridium aceticum]|uniref:Rhodanese domain containing protein n=1 Tax=Clostridium aceticum TaxID=84022 RepID=A0A0G3WFA1_9CLOT|nr:rhodanese-like domain-containing protein [Clostridium aceticum]AKL96602.1 rhodanese domain containing protein [Clostridium aceticum]